MLQEAVPCGCIASQASIHYMLVAPALMEQPEMSLDIVKRHPGEKMAPVDNQDFKANKTVPFNIT